MSTPSGNGAQPATDLTRALNAAVTVPPPDQDPEAPLARRGLLVAMPDGYTVDGPGKAPAWSLTAYQGFLTGSAPETANPSLWRNAVLNMNCGLYEVVPDAVYQVRGADASNISFLETPDGQGVVVVDPLISAECAASAWQMYRATRGQRTVVAVIYTHSHTDHYGGVRGLFDAGQPGPDVQIIAPDGFLEHAISENVYAGNAMNRRATFMYGELLSRTPQTQIDAGLGKAASAGTTGLISPTLIITDDNLNQTIAGLDIEFQLAPETEAPAELHFYLPSCQALCMSENATPTLHNVYSLRGAQVRDAKAWSDYLYQAIDTWGGQATALFASHYWPRWKDDGGDQIVDFLTSQADMYRYLHDQTLHLANQGYTMHEIAEQLTLPDSLASQWYNHGYYGTVSHNVKAIYQRYLGWYDGNAAHLHALPPDKAGPYYVTALGGAANAVQIARTLFDNPAGGADDYRFAAELLSHVVFADPANTDPITLQARRLEADVLEQLGYQAESGPWRNFYLAAAQELRLPQPPQPSGGSPYLTLDVIQAMPLNMIFEYLGIRLNGPSAATQPLAIGLTITEDPTTETPDTPEPCTVLVRNGVLVYQAHAPSGAADATYTLTRDGLNQLTLDQTTIADLQAGGDLTIGSGTIDPITTLVSLLDSFAFLFPLTVP